MDKQLKALKSQFEKEIPTSFTSEDKQAILMAIRKPKPKKGKKITHVFPYTLTSIVIAALIFVGLIVANDRLGLIEFDSKNATGPTTQDIPSEIPDEEEYSTHLKESNGPYITFDPKTVGIGDVFGEMKVSDIQQTGNKIRVTFDGESMLAGQVSNEDILMIMPEKESLTEFPLAKEDIGRRVPFFFQNSKDVEIYFGIEKLTGFYGDFVINVEQIQYTYRPEGSSIDLRINMVTGKPELDEPVTETNNTTINLSDELLERYKESSSLDDRLLQNLTPLNIFNLDHYAGYVGNSEVEYALYIKGETYGTPDKGTYFTDTFYPEAEISEQNEKEFYEKLQKVHTYDEVHISDNEVVITCQPPDDLALG